MDDAALAPNNDIEHRPAIYIVWAIYLVWITFFTQQFMMLFYMGLSLRFWVTLLGTSLFFGFYIGTAWSNGQRMLNDFPSTAITFQVVAPLVVMIALSVSLRLIAGPPWGGLLIYTTAITAGRLPFRIGFVSVGALAALGISGSWLFGAGQNGMLTNIFTILVTGFTTLAMTWAFNTNRELRRARKELARLAVTEERLRFARDLHDLLGHSLSLIALKSELARKLIPLTPERAASEISDIEAAARQALQEVREAVAGYRQPTLEGELTTAQEMLVAAGIQVTHATTGTPSPLRLPQEAMLGWTVREGITNIIRHSQACHCDIQVHYGTHTVGVQIIDDGQGPSPGAATSMGNGLRGLAERAATLGGTCVAMRPEHGGFCLSVMLPLQLETKRAPMNVIRGGVRP